METETETKIAPIPSTKIAGGQLSVLGGTVLPENMKQVESLAQYMSKAGSAIPYSMQGNPGECMAVIMDAIAWRMNPWAVARQRYVTKSKDGNLTGGYMGQLFMAVLNTRAPLKERMIPVYEGKAGDLVCKLRGETVDGQVLEYESPPLKEISPQNSPLWKSDPKQQIAYYSFRAFGRRYFPELFMGIYDPEEVDHIARMRDITPDKPVKNLLEDEEETPISGEMSPLTEKLVRQETGKPDPREGATDVTYDEETGEITGIDERAAEKMRHDITESVVAEAEAQRADEDQPELIPSTVEEKAITADRILENLTKGARACRTPADYKAWLADNLNAETKKLIGPERWKKLGEVRIEVEDAVGYM